jgi:hypothetical protein
MNANKYAFAPPITGPWRVSPARISFGRVHSNRPKARCSSSGPGAARFSSSLSNSRCRVRSDGAHPVVTCRTRRTCAAVRPGFSLFRASASARTSSGVRGAGCRGDGTSASNPLSS